MVTAPSSPLESKNVWSSLRAAGLSCTGAPLTVIVNTPSESGTFTLIASWPPAVMAVIVSGPETDASAASVFVGSKSAGVGLGAGGRNLFDKLRAPLTTRDRGGRATPPLL